MIATVITIVNFRVVTRKFLGKKDQPYVGLKILSIIGIIILTGFTTYFLATRFYFLSLHY